MPISTAHPTAPKLLKDLSATLASICFPAGWRLCDELLMDARRLPICDHCVSQFPPILPGYCEKCGLPATCDPEFPKEMPYCADCQQHRFGFELARSYGYYEGTLSRSVVFIEARGKSRR